MNPSWKAISDQLQKIVSQLPEEWVIKIANKLISSSETQQKFLRTELMGMIPKSSSRVLVNDLLDVWLSSDTQIRPDALGYAILAASKVEKHHQGEQQMELVWTGPSSQKIPLRRTDQALLQVIREAQDRLLIISFAVYKVAKIFDGIIAAAGRGVEISILVESAEESAGKLTHDGVLAFGKDIHHLAKFYVWPQEKRLLSPDGNFGVLHAKVAVADGKVLFVSSANLTEHAMSLNMEMGVLIHGGGLPGQVEGQFENMIKERVIQRIEIV